MSVMTVVILAVTFNGACLLWFHYRIKGLRFNENDIEAAKEDLKKYNWRSIREVGQQIEREVQSITDEKWLDTVIQRIKDKQI